MIPQTEQRKSENFHSKDILNIENSEDNKSLELLPASEIGTDFSYKHEVIWLFFIGAIFYHIIALYAIYLFFTFQMHPLTWIYVFALTVFMGFGVTMGAHRLFSHRSFKATKTLRRFLLFLFTINGQNSLFVWVRNHRQHHKYSDTDADPHNARRGFWFSHIAWFLLYRHPKVIQYSKEIDMSDLSADSWIVFQKKHFILIYIVVAVCIPSIIPIVLWNEEPWTAFLVCFVGRACAGLNFTCMVNSYAHMYGTKPYDKSILPRQNKFVNLFVLGEGWHNFHHVFPWDYRGSELGLGVNLTTNLIDFCAKMGWAYDRKKASTESIKKRVIKTGDNTHEIYGNEDNVKEIE